MHFHIEGLQPTYRQLLDSEQPPTGCNEWPTGEFVPIEDNKKRVMFVPAVQGSPSMTKPFATWTNGITALNITRGTMCAPLQPTFFFVVQKGGNYSYFSCFVQMPLRVLS